VAFVAEAVGYGKRECGLMLFRYGEHQDPRIVGEDE
jgi:hypothetical protein